MKTSLGHVQLNVDGTNFGFYKELFNLVRWHVIFGDDDVLGVGAGGTSLWLAAGANPVANDHDGPGLNHIGFHTETTADVDAAVAWLKERGIELLYGTPCHRPEYESDTDVYYS